MSRQMLVCCVILVGCIVLLSLGIWGAAPIHAQSGSAPTPTPTRITWSDETVDKRITDFLHASYDPVNKIILLFPVDPSVRIVIGGQDVNFSAQATPTPLDAAALRGKIIFKSTRDGGKYPYEYFYYSMNPDGSEVTRLNTEQTKEFLNVVQGLEGFSPDRTQVVIGERSCNPDEDTDVLVCALYILSVQEHAKMIFSENEPSQGEWFRKQRTVTKKGDPDDKDSPETEKVGRGAFAKDPVWSPRGDYIAFVSNHETPAGCVPTMNLFIGTPKQNPVIRRLTSYCAWSDTGHPSFSPDGSQIVYWTQYPGPNHDIYVIGVGTDDSFDWRVAQPKRITFESDNWDPIWVK